MALRSFNEAAKLVFNVAKSNTEIMHVNFSAALMERLARLTPVDRGYAKGNWQASIDDGSFPEPSRERDQTKTGLKAKRKALKELSSMIKGARQALLGANLSSRVVDTKLSKQDIYIKNGVVGVPRKDGKYSESVGKGYIIQLNEGKSQQAPYGMVYPTLARANSIYKKVKRKGKA